MIKYYENGVLKYSVSTPATTFVPMNTIQIGSYPYPGSSFVMYKASVEFYLKPLNVTEILNNYQFSLNNTLLLDTCNDLI